MASVRRTGQYCVRFWAADTRTPLLLLGFLNLVFNEGDEVAVSSLPRTLRSGFQVGESFRVLTKIGLGKASIEVDVRHFRFQTEGLIVVGARLLESTKSNFGTCPTNVGGNVFGPCTDGLFKVGNGTLAFIGLEPGNAPVVVVVRDLRREAGGDDGKRNDNGDALHFLQPIRGGGDQRRSRMMYRFW